MEFQVGQIVWSLRSSPFSNRPRHARKGAVTKIESSGDSYIVWCKFPRDKQTECYSPEDFGVCLFETYEQAKEHLDRTKY